MSRFNAAMALCIKKTLYAGLSLLPAHTRNRLLLRIFVRTGRDSLSALQNEPDKQEELQKLLSCFAAAVERRGGAQEQGALLKILLDMHNQLYRLISLYARTFDNGSHPKHRLTGYHKFFCNNIGPHESVLDIGCGNGFLTSDMAKSTSGRVVGIDKNAANIDFAKTHYQSDNIEFICGDVTSDIRLGAFDVVALSNVLEHLPDRVQFLKRVIDMVSPKRFLIRVPMYEREWMTPLKKELGIDYRLDATHVLEYTQEQLVEELAAAALTIRHLEIKWGEFWLCANGVSSGHRSDC